MIRIPVIALLAFASVISSVRGEPDVSGTLFQEGNRAFSTGKFKDAVANYESLVKSGAWSSNLFYNLGNAYYRDHDFGRAILNYERALRIDPRHPEAQANLQLAREETRALEFAPSLVERYFGALNISGLIVAAAGCFWLGIILLVAKPQGTSLGVAFICLILSGICGFALYSLQNGIRGRSGAVTLEENTQARIAIADSARSILALPAGSEILILEPRGDWIYAELPNSNRGWIPAKAAEKIDL